MTAALRHPPVRDLCSPDYELSHHTHRETLPGYPLALLLDDKAAAIVAANKIAHDREDVPDDTQTLRIDWTAAVTYAAGGAVIAGMIVWGIPLFCAALAWIGGAL